MPSDGKSVLHHQAVLADVVSVLAAIVDHEHVVRIPVRAAVGDDLGVRAIDATGVPRDPTAAQLSRQGQERGLVLVGAPRPFVVPQHDVGLDGRRGVPVADHQAAVGLELLDPLRHRLVSTSQSGITSTRYPSSPRVAIVSS